MLVGERTTAATRMLESADSAAMLDPDYALLPIWCRSQIIYNVRWAWWRTAAPYAADLR